MSPQLITATPKALDHLRELMAAEAPDVTGVRLGVKGGGCSGLSYLLEFGAQQEWAITSSRRKASVSTLIANRASISKGLK